MKKLIIGIMLICVLVGVAACSSGTRGTSQYAMGTTTTTKAWTTQANSRDGSFYAPTPTVTFTVPPISAGDGYENDSSAAPAIQRMIIRTGGLTLVVEDVARSIENITDLATRFNGFVVNSNNWQDGERMMGNISIRVEAQRFDEAMKALRDMAVDVTYESTSGQDVTEEYVDLTAQLKNLEASEAQLLELMKQAGDVEQILAVQKELTNTRGQIEQTKGRMQYIEQSAAMSLIQITLEQSKLSVEFTAGTRNVEEGQAVPFSPQVSGGFSPYSYAWDFGDGNTSKEEQPSHTYDKTGTYKVSLTVTDDRGNKDTYDRTDYIVVTEQPGWSGGGIAKGAWHGLVGLFHVLLDILIWVGIFSPLWIAILIILYFTLWRKRKKKSQ